MNARVNRREFISLLGGTAAAWPLAAHAQQAGKLPTIGFLGADASAFSPWTAAFVARLRELGWIENRNVAIEYRWSEGRTERYAEIAAEFVRMKVDVIVTVGSAVPTVRQATSVIPIVRDFVRGGGFMSYGPSYTERFGRAADYVDKILRGTKPGDIPVEHPTKFELVVNLITAQALGLTVPPTLLARADEVFE